METRKLKMICTKSKLGHSLSQISELTGLSIDQVKQILAQATGLSPEVLSNIFDMKQRGLSLELISQESDVELEVLKQFLPQVIKKTVETQASADQEQEPYEINIGERAYTLGSDHCMNYSRSPPTTTKKTKQPPQPTKTLPKPQHCPTLFYCYDTLKEKLHSANLLTSKESCHKMPSYRFRFGSRKSELPGGSLLITGGLSGERKVEKIDTTREYAVSSLSPMHAPRINHAAVYHSQYLYVLGGYNKAREFNECERYLCAESRWEELPALPVACDCISAVEVENSLYALGGRALGMNVDAVQKLSLDSLTWELMQLKLPQAQCFVPLLQDRHSSVLNDQGDPVLLHSFPNQGSQDSYSKIICRSSYYSRGTLYYEWVGVCSLALGI
jgi:hypothetical protein